MFEVARSQDAIPIRWPPVPPRREHRTPLTPAACVPTPYALEKLPARGTLPRTFRSAGRSGLHPTDLSVDHLPVLVSEPGRTLQATPVLGLDPTGLRQQSTNVLPHRRVEAICTDALAGADAVAAEASPDGAAATIITVGPNRLSFMGAPRRPGKTSAAIGASALRTDHKPLKKVTSCMGKAAVMLPVVCQLLLGGGERCFVHDWRDRDRRLFFRRRVARAGVPAGELRFPADGPQPRSALDASGLVQGGHSLVCGVPEHSFQCGGLPDWLAGAGRNAPLPQSPDDLA